MPGSDPNRRIFQLLNSTNGNLPFTLTLVQNHYLTQRRPDKEPTWVPRQRFGADLRRTGDV